MRSYLSSSASAMGCKKMLLAFLILFMASCSFYSGESPGDFAGRGNIVHVAIKNFKFVPSDVSLKVGDSVIWTNEDDAAHTIQSDDGTLMSEQLSKGDVYAYTFSKEGKYDYTCGIHPEMKGTVTVK